MCQLTMNTFDLLDLLYGSICFSSIKKFFENCSVCESLTTGVILPLFKGKGAKPNNKDNYRGITLFLTLCKIYEMVHGTPQ